MLVLSREVGQRIIIAENISVTVLEIDRGRVRLGVSAPPNVRIDRQEVHSQRTDSPRQTSDKASNSKFANS